MDEIWKDIPGYEGLYQASTFGRIRSLDREIVQKHGNTQYIRIKDGKLLNPHKDKDSYPSVILYNKSRKSFGIHVLVMLTFVGKRPSTNVIRHLDGNPQNNNISNLKYGTQSDNIIDVYRVNKAWQKLKTNEVVEIRKLIKEGFKQRDIAFMFGVSNCVINDIHKERTFWWLSEEGVING